MLIALVFLHGVVGLGLFSAGRRLGRRAFAVAALPPIVTLAWLATRLGGLLDGETVTNRMRWVPSLGVEVVLRLDAFGAVMVLGVSGIGLAVLAYSWSYFGAGRTDYHRIAGLLTMFAGAMLGIVLADELITLFTAWELTSITSYLLIGIEYEKAPARASALHALLVTSAGGLVMLAGIVLIGQAAGTFRTSAILAHPPAGTTVTVGLVCLCIGAFTKSAQYPFHSWLPGAMAAPTPISAYLHSATMVKAGVYLLGRFAPVFALTAFWRPLVLTVGIVTMIAGGLRALRQYDLKLLLAYGTVSQLGFLVVLFGAGTPAATQAAITVIIAHALFKAALFMVVGVIDHQTGTRDVRLVPALGPGWGPTKAVAVLSAVSMAGVPLLAGFVAKESAYTAFVEGSFPMSGWVLAGLVVGSVLTCAYSLRFIWGVTVLPRRLRTGVEQVTIRHPDQRLPGAPERAAPPPTWAFIAPGVALTSISLLFGLAPGLESALVSAATLAVDPTADPHPLELWHGINRPLALTLLTFAIGGLIFLARRPVARFLRLGDLLPTGTEVYVDALNGLNRTATRVTAIVQNGTLSIYAGVVLATAAVLPGAVLLRRVDWPGWPEFVGRPAQIPITIALVGGALMAATVRRRFTAVLFLSTVGYAMAALFVVQGAPDLALTQTAIETLSTVLFVLVLRRLPDRFERRSSPFTRSVRVTISAAVGLLVFAFAIISRQSRRAEPVSTEMIERALPDAKGANVVNVILVDFRGFDTMGELTVLVAAAIGCVALARAGRRPSLRPAGAPVASGAPVPATRSPDRPTVDSPPQRGPANRPRRPAPGTTIDLIGPSVQVIFHAVLLASVYLLVAGHNHPGGGFVGGLVASAGIAVGYITGGIGSVRRLARLRPWTILGAGLLIATVTATAPLLFGRTVLDSAKLDVDIVGFGHVGVSSVLAFDLGVYLVVIGLTLMVFEAFGDDDHGDDRDAVAVVAASPAPSSRASVANPATVAEPPRDRVGSPT